MIVWVVGVETPLYGLQVTRRKSAGWDPQKIDKKRSPIKKRDQVLT